MAEATSEKQLTGRHVLLMLLAFFGVMFVVNIIFAYLAVTSFTGEDVPKSYQQGVEYNKTIQARQAQQTLNWAVYANSYKADDQDTTIVVKILDETSQPVPDLSVTGIMRHPTDKAFDRNVELQSYEDGLYRANIDLTDGTWTLVATAKVKDRAVYKFTHDVWVK